MKLSIKDVFRNTKFKVEEECLPIKPWRNNNIVSIKLEKRPIVIKTHGKSEVVYRNSLLGRIEGGDWKIIVSDWKYENKISLNRLVAESGYLKFKLSKDQIGVWYKSGDGHIRFIILPKFIEIDKGVLELIGLLDGEMTEKESIKSGMTLRITNTEPTIIKHIVECFKIFSITPDNWKVSITINSKNKKVSKAVKEEFKAFWSEITSIPLKNFGKITLQNKLISKFSPYGIVQLRYNNELFWNFVMNFIEFSHKLILRDEKFAVNYLRGLIAGEGGVGLRKNGKLRFVQIGVTKPNHREFYIKLLESLGIENYRVYKERIEIYSLKNFELLNKWKIFGLNPSREIRFKESFNRLKFYYGLNLNLAFNISKGNQFTHLQRNAR